MSSVTSIVEVRGQSAYTSSIVVAEGCGISHKQAIALIRKYASDFQELGQLAFETRVTSSSGAGQAAEVAILGEDHATYLITLFRNTPTVRRFKLALVKDFRRALNEIARLYANPPRKDILAAKRAAHHVMADALVEFREEAGKETDARHFMCENKLVNWVVTGKFSAIDEASLSNEDAELLRLVRERNASLLNAGLSYEERKDRLPRYAVRARTKLLN